MNRIGYKGHVSFVQVALMELGVGVARHSVFLSADLHTLWLVFMSVVIRGSITNKAKSLISRTECAIPFDTLNKDMISLVF